MEYLYPLYFCGYTGVVIDKQNNSTNTKSIRHTVGSQFPNRVSFDIKDLQFLSKNLQLPLDFFGKNSYYLSVGCVISIPSFLISGKQGACLGVKIYFQLRRRNLKINTLARKILCPMALRTDSRCGTIGSILFRVRARISERAGHGMQSCSLDAPREACCTVTAIVSA